MIAKHAFSLDDVLSINAEAMRHNRQVTAHACKGLWA